MENWIEPCTFGSRESLAISIKQLMFHNGINEEL